MEDRQKLREAYKNEAKIAKYKHSLKAKLKDEHQGTFKRMGEYGDIMLWMSTDDEVLWHYSKKLQRKMQWVMVTS